MSIVIKETDYYSILTEGEFTTDNISGISVGEKCEFVGNDSAGYHCVTVMAYVTSIELDDNNNFKVKVVPRYSEALKDSKSRINGFVRDLYVNVSTALYESILRNMLWKNSDIVEEILPTDTITIMEIVEYPKQVRKANLIVEKIEVNYLGKKSLRFR